MEPKIFGNALRNTRKRKKMTLEKLGEKAGFKKSYLSLIENGKQGIPQPETLRKLADGLEFPYSQMMFLAGYTDHNPALLVGRFVSSTRYDKGISLEELSKKTEISIEKLNGVETGHTELEKKEIYKIANALVDDSNEIEEVSEKLLRLAGYTDEESEINYVDSLLEAFNQQPSLNRFNVESDEGIIAQGSYDFPVNDLFFHLTDEHNYKMFKTVKLDEEDRNYIEKMIRIYLIIKHEDLKEDDKEEEDYYDQVLEILNDRDFEFPKMRK